MPKLYPAIFLICCFCTIFSKTLHAQDCSLLHATFVTYESRCAATGAIKVSASGGSGSYKYKTIGPVNSNFTTTDSITGLSAGTYTVVVNDIVTNCTFTRTGIVVTGTYQDPRFTLTGIDVSCDNSNNGSITVNGQQNGRSPFAYTIVAPSPMGVGTTNNTGLFNNLIAGNYIIRLTDSCGGIQTRQITINDYTWRIDSYVFNKILCDSVSGYITVIDSRGNTSTAGGIPGFTYGIVRQPGDTLWSSSPDFTFYLAGTSPFDIVAKDACGIIKKVTTSVSLSSSVGATVNIYNKTCNSFSVSLNSITNFFNADFCLYDVNNIQILCNTTGVFTNLPYGSYCIKAHDACSDTTIIRCFTGTPPVASVGDNVIISNKICHTFTAGITGQSNLTNPGYCLYDSLNVLITCNTTGVFDSLAYGTYCIETKDGCIDTTIKRCFMAMKPMPVIDSLIPSYGNCTNFGIVVRGDSLTNPQYCLYDSTGTLIQCDTTGIFDSIPLGNYCVHIYDACLDTTIIRCLNVGPPLVINDMAVSISNRACSTFTASVSSSNLKDAYYCLYDTANVLIACDSTGIFDGLPYGGYCIKAKNGCPDTTFTTCFTVVQPTPSVNGIVVISNTACATFTARITNQQNLSNPQYCIYDSSNVQLSCNSTGVFTNLLYGAYCIKIINSCYDTTITRCFARYLTPVQISVAANKSCSYGYSKFNVSISGGALPVNIKIYNAGGDTLFDIVSNSRNFSIDSIPGVPALIYKIIVTDNCGNMDSASISPITSYLDHAPFVVAKCPGGAWLNGSGNIQITAASNMGSLTVRIIKKNNVALAPQLIPDNVSGGVYTFNDLEPATYIISYKANDACNIYIYDTLTVQPYQFPNLDRSSAYQCDVNGFSVGAVASNGVGPFTYEIIGSTPSAPSIIAGPQTSPVFNIDNATNYSLIRLRALDACGNATLGDASILPLADDEIISSENCLFLPTTLSVDSIYNSTYAWYKKINLNDTDSTFVGAGSSYFIPTVLPSDTGFYICHIVVNSGCITRTYLYHLDAACYTVLPAAVLEFTGKFIDDKVLLNWKTTRENNLKNYIVEHKNSYNTFIEIGRKDAGRNSLAMQQYNFLDTKPDPDKNYYRLKLISNNNTFTYSNIILLTGKPAKPGISIYPNPVTDVLNINLGNTNNHVYKISLYNMVNQLMSESSFMSGIGNQLQITRTTRMTSGMYVVKIIDENNNEQFSQKVIFR